MEAQLTRCHPTGAFKPYHMAFNRGRGGKGRERGVIELMPTLRLLREGGIGRVSDARRIAVLPR